ncbi:MAG: CDP-diacylglycerol--glycerol-3-phosphate 3-phosphatidyltransferase [Eubacteriales bacterium]|nr:CDP-diacylglycerol--glycerol-3-phosphate 3-phosphatidyltransferase [Eubacteriales bacterium]
MNLPNRLTLLRVLMIPFFVFFMLMSIRGADIAVLRTGAVQSFIIQRYISFVIFAAASFTDFLDGMIARKFHLVTDFGKFMDPLADKLLVCSALILLTAEGSLSAVVVIVVIAREFIISGFRLIAADNGIVIAASWWGKFKTVFQMLLCMALILPTMPAFLGETVMSVLTAAVLVLTIVSLADYMIKNIKVITDGGM